ncbi:uncharacterized protein LOC114443395 [Parambassis ranga]|uniref:Uncharacterized protein LOC114443395 n=1 Tax=Parambassis ranga TaxID=210632 RepID=A0A6P7J8N0_9TELE|nr:uncharacterized protein LOC114443395 [Parambassis ranga]
MFAYETKAVVKNVGAREELIANDNLNHNMELLTLVRVTEGRFWQVPKIKVMDSTLRDLLEEEFSPEIEEQVLVEDFSTMMQRSGSGSVGGSDGNLAEGEISAKADMVDGLDQPVTMIRKKAKMNKVRRVKKSNVQDLDLSSRDKLAFVYQTVYNSGPVKLIRKAKKEGSVSASCQKMLSLLVKGSMKEETNLTVPEKSTFAFGLREIKLEDKCQDGTLKISSEPFIPKAGLERVFCDAITDSSPILEHVKEELEMKQVLLQPLAELPESTCCELLRTLRQLLEDGDALSQLEQTLDRCSDGASVRPQSQLVASFMDLLDASTALKDAAHLLVSAMDTLPDGAALLLTACSQETLTVLTQLVDSLKRRGEASLPESVPLDLQQDGALRWAAELLCSSHQMLSELSKQWNGPPEVLLEVLCLTVHGLSLMQPRGA